MLNVSLFRIIRKVEYAPEKEVIKEFLRFIGCMVSDHPVIDRDDSTERGKLEENTEEAVDLYLLDKHESPDVVERVDSDKHSRTLRVNVYVQQFRQFQEKRGKGAEEGKAPADYFFLIDKIIDAVWQGKSNQLKEIANIFFDHNLFGYFQCKRSFRIINMVEVYGPRFQFGEKKRRIDVSIPESLTTKYIKNMLRSFGDAYKELRNIQEPDVGSDVYVRYAKVNIARKIREVCSLLEDAPKDMFNHVEVKKAEDLLSELDDLYRINEKYMGTLFLATAVCKSDSTLYLTSANYFRLLLDLIKGRSGPFYSFANYEYGRQLERVHRDWDAAILFYRKAVSLNPLNYQALFKLGCYEAYKGRYQEAIGRFQILRDIITNFYDKGDQGDVDKGNLSLKIIQYLYKTDIWLWILHRELGYGISADAYREKAQSDAEQYSDNQCIKTIYGISSNKMNELQEYHEQSLPVRIMKAVVE